MNEIVNKFLLVGDTLKTTWFCYRASGPFTKNKDEMNNLSTQKIKTLFTQMRLVKLVFNMIRLMVNQKI